MKNLYASLREYSQENDLETVHDQQNANPDELMVVTDSTQTDLEECVQEIAEEVAELQDKGADAEQLAEAVESLENFIKFAQASRQSGNNLNALAARGLTMGMVQSLEARSIPPQWYHADISKIAESFEAERYDYSQEAEDTAKSLKERILTVLRNAYKAVVEFFSKIVDKFRGAGVTLGAAGERLEKLAIDLEGKSVDGDVKLNAKSYAALFTNSGAFNPHTACKEGFNAIDQAYDVSKTQIDYLKKKTMQGSADATPTASVILTGGYVIQVNEKGAAKLVQVKPVDKSKLEGTVPLATPSLIQQVGKELTGLSVVLHGIESDNKKLIGELDTLVKAASDALAKMDDGEGKAGAQVRLSEVTKGISAVKGIVPLAVRHATRVANEANRFCLASAARYAK